jgi:hypothetical protein
VAEGYICVDDRYEELKSSAWQIHVSAMSYTLKYNYRTVRNISIEKTGLRYDHQLGKKERPVVGSDRLVAKSIMIEQANV